MTTTQRRSRMAIRAGILVQSLFVLGACGTTAAKETLAPAPIEREAVTPARPARVHATQVARVPLLWEVETEAGRRPLHVPLIEVTIGSVTTLLVVDSGATHHVFTKHLARQLGVVTKPGGAAGTDHVGAHVKTDQFSERIEWEIGGHHVVIDDALAIDGPAPFAGWGIGGFVSPEALMPDATVVLDLAEDSLQLWKGERGAIERQVSDDHPHHEAIILASVVRSDDPRPVVRATVDGKAASFLINTGSKAAELDPTLSSAPVHGPEAALSKGVSGTEVTARVAASATWVVAGRSLTVPNVHVRPQKAQFDGQWGTALLRGTVIAIGPTGTQTVTWWVPPTMLAAHAATAASP